MISGKCVVSAWLAGLSLALLISGSSAAQQELPSALSGFEPSELYDVIDESQFSASDEFMIRLLFRAANASPESWQRYAEYTRGIGLQAIDDHPQKYRFQVFELTGRVKMVYPIGLPEKYENSKLKGFYLARVESDTGKSFVIAARSVPRVWPIRTSMDEPFRCRGFFQAIIDFSGPAEASPARELGADLSLAGLFVTDRMGWFPDRAGTVAGVNESHLLLARNGVDIGQFEFVKQNNNRAITESDSSCFFQLLDAVERLTPDDFKGNQIGFVELLENPKDHFGGAVQFTGHVKRAVRIYIDRKAVRERLGLDYYYELDMFIPLGDSRIVIKSRTPDDALAETEDVVYKNRFPATVCVPRLPVTTEEIRGKRVTIDGFFMKFWNYDSEFTSRLNPSLGQVSPLVIGIEPTISNSSKHSIDNFLLTALGVIGLSIFGLIWYFRRSDQRQKNPMHGRLYELQDDLKLDPLDTNEKAPDDGKDSDGIGITPES